MELIQWTCKCSSVGYVINQAVRLKVSVLSYNLNLLPDSICAQSFCLAEDTFLVLRVLLPC
jgi:hypothetical protein